MVKQDNTDAFKHEFLLALYHETWSEITRLRDYEWKIAYYFIVLTGSIIVFVVSDGAQPVLSLTVRWVLTIIQIVSMFLAVFYLEVTHGYLTQQRNIRRSIEELLGLYEKGKFTKESILPEEWKGKRITKGYQRMGLVIPLTTTVVIAHLFCIFVIWKVPGNQGGCF